MTEPHLIGSIAIESGTLTVHRDGAVVILHVLAPSVGSIEVRMLPRTSARVRGMLREAEKYQAVEAAV